MTPTKHYGLIQTVEQGHQRALGLLTDAYLFHQVSMHRRPVYRHQHGDIHLNQPSVSAFLDSHLAEKGWSLERRWAWFQRCLDLDAYMHRENSKFIDWGTVPELKPRGIRWINACFERLGEMVEDLGGWEKSKAYPDKVRSNEI
jgi:hypothetical protein